VNAALAALEAQVDRDLTLLHAEIGRAIARELAGDRPNLAALGRTIDDLIFSRYGASVGEAPISALGRYLEGQVGVAFQLGYGKDIPGYLPDWDRAMGRDTLAESLRLAGANLSRMLKANLAAFARADPAKFSKADALRYLLNFLTIEGADPVPSVAKGANGLYEVRRILYSEIMDAHGLAARARAKREGGFFRWVRSPAHQVRDECDRWAEMDIGYGPGVFPYDTEVPYPNHPHEQCHLEPVEVSEEVQRRVA
jgi:hypothetical protein